MQKVRTSDVKNADTLIQKTRIKILLHYRSKVWVCFVFWKKVCSQRLHLIDQKYNKNTNIAKYYDNLKYLCHMKCDGKAEFIYNPKSEKVGTVWKTQIKKESSDF